MRLPLDERGLAGCAVRSWCLDDVTSLARHANNWNIWINLRDAFPHPYTEADAKRFIEFSLRRSPESHFAIAVNDQAVGAVGLKLHEDVERCSGEIGYWLGESYWGCGIATAVLDAVTEYAFPTFNLTRIYALPFEWNTASVHVLEKVGYECEARLRRSAIKNGKLCDQFLYAIVSA